VVNRWVQKGIVLGFRLGQVEDFSINRKFRFFDKDTFPLKTLEIEEGVRVVPGGSSIRDGAFVGRGVVCMPPMFINVGAYVDEGTLIDSQVVVGSCAQIGKHVQLSAGALVGGILEPSSSFPVIIEDDVQVGGGCGLYEGTLVKRGAVLAPGTVLTRYATVYDLVNEVVFRAEGGKPLTIPRGAVVVPGTRPAKGGLASREGLGVYAPIIIKYRDPGGDASSALERAMES
jgi:2,3,4,5-tetrahydropyridine-2-carboxylate N-succinyltransferase